MVACDYPSQAAGRPNREGDGKHFNKFNWFLQTLLFVHHPPALQETTTLTDGDLLLNYVQHSNFPLLQQQKQEQLST